MKTVNASLNICAANVSCERLSERDLERERERLRGLITGLFRKGPPVIMAMLLNESNEPHVLCRTPRTPLHLSLITTRCSSFAHDTNLIPSGVAA